MQDINKIKYFEKKKQDLTWIRNLTRTITNGEVEDD